MPLAVGGDDVPRRRVGVAAVDRVVVRVEVVVPVLGVVEVAGVVLPILRRVVEPSLLALAPLVERDVQEALDDRGACVGELPLEAVDRVVALRPGGARSEVANADDENVLVMGATE